MIKALISLFGPRPQPDLPAVPRGERIYAVGDIHGRLDLMVALAEAIEADDRARGPADTTVILLGDLVDRGPDSSGVIAAARMWAQQRSLRFIIGNHEEMFLESFENIETLRHFLKYGGRETVLSYAIDPITYSAADLDEVQAMMAAAVPKEDLDFLRSFEDSIVKGDYLFVHAGIHPGVAIADQSTSHMRWIREPFLSHAGDLGHVVVHGHTIMAEAEVLSNRIGIDTGAYNSGRLTVLGLEGTDRWLIETRDDNGTITTASRSAA